MRHSLYRQTESQDAFTDLLFNALLGFVFMFVAAFSLMGDPTKSGNVENKAEILITVRWADRHPDDVDTLVEDPQGNLVWYHNRDTGLMHLDRDDRGLFQDRVMLDGVEVSNPINQETVTLRALKPGEYVVNVLHYQSNYKKPLPVSVKVEKLNPRVTLIYYGIRELTGVGDEQTAVRFTIGANGEVIGTNELKKSLLVKAVKSRI
ncbi:MAG: hypothetical protein E2O61_07795 [Gammaproteobacteria bacterium]|nr:MAG: hypothetical protein E2O61_07795 [Gammaproteobacteria bacterium]